MVKTLPSFFPGDLSLVSHASVEVTQHSANCIRSRSDQLLTSVRLMPNPIWISNVRAAYYSDPVVLELLDILEGTLPQTNTSAVDHQETTSGLKPWGTYF